jgi:hypothetical protein
MCSFCTGAYVSRIDVFSNICRPTWDFGRKKYGLINRTMVITIYMYVNADVPFF